MHPTEQLLELRDVDRNPDESSRVCVAGVVQEAVRSRITSPV